MKKQEIPETARVRRDLRPPNSLMVREGHEYGNSGFVVVSSRMPQFDAGMCLDKKRLNELTSNPNLDIKAI